MNFSSISSKVTDTSVVFDFEKHNVAQEKIKFTIEEITDALKAEAAKRIQHSFRVFLEKKHQNVQKEMAVTKNLSLSKSSSYKAERAAKESFLIALRCLATAREILPDVIKNYSIYNGGKEDSLITMLQLEEKKLLLTQALHGTTIQKAIHMKFNGVKDIYPTITSSSAGTGFYFSPVEKIAMWHAKVQLESVERESNKAIGCVEGIAVLKFSKDISQLRIGRIDENLLAEAYSIFYLRATLTINELKKSSAYKDLCKRYQLDPNNESHERAIQRNLRSEYQRDFFSRCLGYDMITWDDTKEGASVCVYYPETIGLKVDRINLGEKEQS
jgi:hypothetical protein